MRRSAAGIGLVALMVGGCGAEICMECGDGWQPATWQRPELGPGEAEDVFSLAEPRLVDVLWVVDHHPWVSIGGLSVPDFLHAWTASLGRHARDSWHLGITATDVGPEGAQGRLQVDGGEAFVSSATPESVQRVGELAVDRPVPEEASSGLCAAMLALRQPTALQQEANAGFRRPGADLRIVFVSSTDDVIAAEGWGDDLPKACADLGVDTVDAWLAGIADGEGVSVGVAALVGSGAHCADEARPSVPVGDEAPGVAYQKLAQAWPMPGLGVVTASACDWGRGFAQALGRLEGLSRPEEFALSAAADPSTLDVTLVTPEGDVLQGIDIEALGEGTPLDAACEEAGAEACVAYAHHPVRGSVYLVRDGTSVPRPAGQLVVRYTLRSEAAQDEPEAFGAEP